MVLLDLAEDLCGVYRRVEQPVESQDPCGALKNLAGGFGTVVLALALTSTKGVGAGLMKVTPLDFSASMNTASSTFLGFWASGLSWPWPLTTPMLSGLARPQLIFLRLWVEPGFLPMMKMMSRCYSVQSSKFFTRA